MNAKTEAPDHGAFLFSVTPQFSKRGEAGQARQFAGVAYSGEVIANHYYWGDVVFDVATITMQEKTAALIDHDRAQRAGYTTAYDTKGGELKVSGVLLNNAHGMAVAEDSDQGFPWQMSIHIEPARVDQISAGTVEVNGRTYTAPITVFRDSKVVEVTFTATGWDVNTSATAFSRGDLIKGQEMDLKEKNDLLAELQAAKDEAATLREQLAQFSKAARLDKIESLFGDIGRDFSATAEDVIQFAAMADAAFDGAAKVLREQFGRRATKAPEHLFTHQAANGRSGGGEGGGDLDTRFSRMIQNSKGAK